MTNDMGVIKKFKNSLYNFSSYNVFFKQTLGKSVVYLLLLTLLLSLFSVVITVVNINSGFNDFTSYFNNNSPNFEFNNGEFSCDGTMPIIYEDGGETIIIDTRDSASKDILKDYKSSKQAILVTKTKMYQQTAGSLKTTDLKALEGISFNKESVLSNIPLWKIIAIVLVVIFIPIFAFIGNLIVAYLVIGLGGLLISSILHKELKYAEVVKLGIYSMTLPLIITTIWDNVGISFSHSTLLFIIIYLGIAFTYLTLGIRALDGNMYKENISYQAPQFIPYNQNQNNPYNQNQNNQYNPNQNNQYNQNQNNQYNPNQNNQNQSNENQSNESTDDNNKTL